MDQEKIKIEKRTKEFIRHYNELKEAGKFQNNAELVSILGYKRESSITEILKERQNIPPLKYLAFLDHFGLENTDPNTEQYRKADVTPKNYLIDRRNRKIISKPFLVPLVPYKARAGYVKAYDQVEYLEELEQYAIPPNVDPVGQVWRYFEVGGDSMEPALKSGDLLLCSQVPHEDWTQIRNFYIYVGVSDSEIFVKRLVLEGEDEFLLLSENEESYQPRLIKMETLKQLWVVRRHIKKELPTVKKFDLDKIRKKLNRS